MNLRIAMRGWQGAEEATHVDEAAVGLGVWWVEVDGVRVPEVISASFRAADEEFNEATVTLKLPARVQLVYVDGNGDPLPGDPVEVDATRLIGETLAHKSALAR